MTEYPMPEKIAEKRLKEKTFLGLSTFPGMTPAVGFPQVGNGQLGVVLEGVEGLVSEQFLDVVHVRAGSEKLRRTRPAEGVRRDVDGDADGIGVVVHEPPEDVIRFRRSSPRPMTWYHPSTSGRRIGLAMPAFNHTHPATASPYC